MTAPSTWDETTIRPVGRHPWADLTDHVAVLHADSETFYDLEGSGPFVWRAIQEGTTLGELERGLLERYDVDAATCRRELSRLVEELLEAGLVEVSDAVAG